MSTSRGAKKPMDRSTLVSKKLSWLLRHGATSEKLALDEGGYASLADVLANPKIRSVKATVAEVKEIVAENDKQRFSLKLRSGLEDADGVDSVNGGSDKAKDWLIRANQGHSVKGVESEGLLTPIVDGGVPETVVHGTSHAAWTAIVASGGLSKMGRNHIHFAAGLPATFRQLSTTKDETAAVAPVISGMRSSSTVLVYLDIDKAMASGIKFWRSANGVILSEGDAEGKVGLEFFKRVEDRTGEGVLVEDGKVVKEAPAAWASKGKGRR